MYTVNRQCIIIYSMNFDFDVVQHNLLCSPLLVPQMLGGLMPPPPLVTEKVSVKHWVASVTEASADSTMTPAIFLTFVTELVFVEGPAILNVLKSSRIWQMSLPHGQTLAVHPPAITALLSK